MNVFVVACMGFTIWDEYDAPEFSLLVHFWKVFVYIYVLVEGRKARQYYFRKKIVFLLLKKLTHGHEYVM